MRSRLPLVLVLALAATVLLGACASKPQLPVDLSQDALSSGKQTRVGVAMTKMPKPVLHLPGADCLLCIMAAQVANTTLSRHADTLSSDELATVKEQITTSLRSKGLAAKVIAEDVDVKELADAGGSDSVPNLARKNFRPLKEKYGVDKIVVIQIDRVGIERTYASYIPTGDPKGVVRGVAYMVDLSKNTYEWYMPLDVLKAADGAWDEPSQFPGLTNAYFQAIEISRDRLLQPFKR